MPPSLPDNIFETTPFNDPPTHEVAWDVWNQSSDGSSYPSSRQVSPDADGDKERASTPPPDSPSPARISVDQILKPKPSKIERRGRSQSMSERESLVKGPNRWKKQVFKDALQTSTNKKRNDGHPIVSMVISRWRIRSREPYFTGSQFILSKSQP
jgi:hypothetical protein